MARLHGVQTSYRDVKGRTRRASTRSLLAVLRALGEDVDGTADVPGALRRRRAQQRERRPPPVLVAWDGVLPGTDDRLPLGYHQRDETLIVSAPAHAPPARRGWGVFLPLYALRSERNWGIGDLTDLEALIEWTAGLGGDLVATLPLLSTFLGPGAPFEPSPYVPSSRLFWSEVLVDPERAPELQRCSQARRLLASAPFRRELERLRATRRVDYAAVAAAKRRVLEPLAEAFFDDTAEGRRRDFRRFTRERPDAGEHAAFRAAVERGETEHRDPVRDRNGRYHLYVQFLLDEQVEALGASARAAGAGLYLDFPVGVHGAGYDVWRYGRHFASGVSAGAPPDTFFTEGQDWAFPPLHPERSRREGHAYIRACLRHLLRHAAVLRIDHVMGLHRLFWVPEGMSARDGVYVRYPHEELYAILLLEAHLAGAVVVGEDLGTVPRRVRTTMRRHGLHRSYVLQYEVRDDPAAALPDPRPESFASLNTHDMPTFRSFFEGADIDLRLSLGLLDRAGAGDERRARGRTRKALVGFLRRRGRFGRRPTGQGRRVEPGAGQVLRAALRHLARSDARTMIVGLEDLWGEAAPQNVPGTPTVYGNWSRKARLGLESFRERRGVLDTLGEVDRLRNEGGADR